MSQPKLTINDLKTEIESLKEELNSHNNFRIQIDSLKEDFTGYKNEINKECIKQEIKQHSNKIGYKKIQTWLQVFAGIQTTTILLVTLLTVWGLYDFGEKKKEALGNFNSANADINLLFKDITAKKNKIDEQASEVNTIYSNWTSMLNEGKGTNNELHKIYKAALEKNEALQSEIDNFKKQVNLQSISIIQTAQLSNNDKFDLLEKMNAKDVDNPFIKYYYASLGLDLNKYDIAQACFKSISEDPDTEALLKEKAATFYLLCIQKKANQK